MKLNIFSSLQKRAEEKKKEKMRRYWDTSYALRFLKDRRNDIELFELRMYKDRTVGETFIRDGKMVKALDASYPAYHAVVDGVLYTCIDIPTMHIVYNSGTEEWIACYRQEDVLFAECHRKLESNKKVFV